jgi:CheY-like chemotaxis protein
MIDDNKMEHLILQKMLSHYDLFKGGGEHSEDGKVTLDFIKSNRSDAKSLPDIILLDLNMPKFSGWDFLRNFKYLYPTLKKKIDIFILSSSIDPLDQKRSMDYPFVKGFFIKPLHKDALINLYSTYKVRPIIN